MKTACHYAIVRFLPFVETGEFANVGIVMFAPNARYFGFRILAGRYARVTTFFEQLDAKIFRTSMRTFREEMERVADLLKPLGTDRRLKVLDRDASLSIWTEIIKPRETMLRFSDARVVLSEGPADTLRDLFEYYVERNFVTREYQEQILERGVRGWLRTANLHNRFHPAKIGNDEYHTQFPFVETNENDVPEKVIKPLNLDYPDASRIIDHGGQWIVRINALKKRELLPTKVLFTVKGPTDTSTRGKAKSEIIGELREAGVIVVPYGEAGPIVQFALHCS